MSTTQADLRAHLRRDGSAVAWLRDVLECRSCGWLSWASSVGIARRAVCGEMTCQWCARRANSASMRG